MLTAYTFVLRSIGYLFVLQSAKKRMRDDVNENASIPHSSGCGSLCQDRIGNFPLFLELGLKVRGGYKIRPACALTAYAAPLALTMPR